MEKHRLDEIKRGFEEAEARHQARARVGSIRAFWERIFPPLRYGSAYPISEGNVSVDGIGRVLTIMHNQQAGRPLDEGLTD